MKDLRKNLLERFVGWDIESGSRVPRNIFSSARFRITALYFFSGALILVATRLIIDNIIDHSIRNELVKYFSLPVAKDITSHIMGDMPVTVWSLRFGMVVAMAIAAYFIAGVTLAPIRKVVESQKRFIANASHELRTPIALIKTNSDVALYDEKSLTKEEAIKTIQTNVEEINRISDILQILLTFSSYENRANTLTFSHLDLNEFFLKTVSSLEPYAKERGIKISYLGGGNIPIYGNVASLKEMVNNIVRNAITYTPEGGSIDVSLEKKIDGTLLKVRDSGVGIPKEEVGHIFEPFYRGTNGLKYRKEKGVGLGLAIAREIANIHKAEISVESTLGEGTTFFVRFKPT